MARFIVAAGKGGAGKTTLAINLGAALLGYGRHALVLDAGLANPHVGLRLGLPAPERNLHHALSGKARIHDMVYRHESGLLIIPASIRSEDLEDAPVERLLDLKPVINTLTEYVLVDSSPGFTRESLIALRCADEAILVVHPELSSVTEALRIKRYAQQHGIMVLGAVINEARGEQHELNHHNLSHLLGTRIIATIPEDPSVRMAAALNHPVVYSHPASKAADAFKTMAMMIHG